MICRRSLPVTYNSKSPGFPSSTTDDDGNNAIDTCENSGVLQRSHTAVEVTGQAMIFPSDHPTQAIDWILISPDWRFVDYTVVSSKLPDHRPVITNIALESFNVVPIRE